MDELTPLRGLEADTPAPTSAALEHAFDALTERMNAAEHGSREHTPVRRRRRSIRLRSVGLIGAAAVAVVVALVATDVLGVAGLGAGASAQAADLLNRAAGNTIRTVDPVIHAGQFRQITTTDVNLVDTDNSAGQTVTYGQRQTRTVYIPADEQDVWTEVRSPFTFTGQAYGPDAKATAEKDPTFTDPAGRIAQVVHGKAGTQWGGPPQWTPSGVQALPRDPHLLLQYIYLITFGHGQSPPGEAFVFVSDLLRSGLVPADLRAALYRAVALIPGVTVNAHAATLDGKEGVAFGLVEKTTGIRSDLIIDPDTGDLIGEREVTTRPIDLMPANTTSYWTSVSTAIVERVPTEYEP
ncbi:CU044_5270 family protein [Amnibacterium kyonggiense]